jgi:SAM-dependent methyltransferase
MSPEVVSPSIVSALRALVDGDRDRARELAAAATGSRLGVELSRFLDQGEQGWVYDHPAAFELFIRGGGNVELYRATSAALARLYDEGEVRSLLDLGAGDGLAALPALAQARRRPLQVDLVEPSAPMLDRLTADAGERGLTGLTTWATDVDGFLRAVSPGRHWQLAQSTFALHALAPDDRTAVLADLRGRVDALAIVEFDVPAVDVGTTAHLESLAASYEQGLAEYSGQVVAQGFLMPVLVGQLAPDAPRATWEQPANEWVRQVETAGFGSVKVETLAPYWSAPAFLLTARA